MIQEANFNDIRRNYILASIILILFLLYGSNITIEQLLIFKFDKNGDWAILGPYWDILIILSLFFIYTFARYIIYSADDIKRNSYSYKRLITVFQVGNNINNLINTAESYLVVDGNNLPVQNIDVFYNDELSEKGYINVTSGITESGSRRSMQFLLPRKNITSLNIGKYSVSLNNTLFLNFNTPIDEHINNGLIKILFQKEFSDFLWPLGLLFPIVIIIVINGVNLFI